MAAMTCTGTTSTNSSITPRMQMTPTTAILTVRIAVVGVICILGVIEEFVEVVPVQVIAAIDGNWIVGHIPHQEAAPVEVVVQRPRRGIATQKVDCIHRIVCADHAIEAALGEVGSARE